MHFDLNYVLLSEFVRMQYRCHPQGDLSAVFAISDSIIIASPDNDALSLEEVRECEEYASNLEDSINSSWTIRMRSGRVFQIYSYSIDIDNHRAGKVLAIKILIDKEPTSTGSDAIHVKPNCMNRLEVTERIEIQRTLRQTGGNRVKAARILGISRSSLYRKMNSYGLKTE
ncbi:hypothetical protein DBV08_00365 [Rhodococcus sp. KBW08]|nr:hypothetical protein DBV08_00365 [Rhodococcus sp. KBW08]